MKYGDRYWFVLVSETESIQLWADSVEIGPTGALTFYKNKYDDEGGVSKEHDFPLFCLPASRWMYYYAASILHGDAVAVEFWNVPDEDEKVKGTKPRASNGPTITPSIRWRIMKRDKFKCLKCGKSQEDEQLEVDHIKPKADGGTNEDENLQTLCFTCNRGKGAR